MIGGSDKSQASDYIIKVGRMVFFFKLTAKTIASFCATRRDHRERPDPKYPFNFFSIL